MDTKPNTAKHNVSEH